MKTNDADLQRGSGLFIGSEPLEDVHHRSAMGKDDDDSSKKDGLLGDDDSSDKGDTDTTDKVGDRGDDSRDSDGKD